MPLALVSPAGVEIARRLMWARTPAERARGLLGRFPLQPGEALVIEDAAQVHTFGMRYRIDVVFCARDWSVRYAVRAMSPGRLTKWVRGASLVVETVAGTLDSSVAPGSRLSFLFLTGGLSQEDRRSPS